MNKDHMNFNFDAEINRRGTNSYKWDSRTDVPADTIPLWVADMDFRVAPPIQEALQRRIDQGVFGYTYVPQAYYDSVTDWFRTYHGWTFRREDIIYTSGVVPAISAIIKALAKEGDKVLIQTPVYNCFFSSIRNNGCTALESPLALREGRYTVDFEDFEAKASDPRCSLFLLCNPHNPAGRVWSRSELSRMAQICRRHGVTVISDEIHCELVFGPEGYNPFATVAGDCDYVSCISPSKSFNIAGLQIANIVVPDAVMRQKIDRAININEVCDVNPFGVVATIAAYRESRPWLLALIPYLYKNYEFLRDVFAASLPELPVIQMEGTYLAWVDCRRIGVDSEALEEYLIEHAHVWLNAGSMYGRDGEGFMRVNLACPASRLQDAVGRLVPVLRSLLDH